uniref:GmrSD restriction endonucleases N-terminal domain-containing protein n=1 Tax=uncultured Methanosarcinales archaeon TaxID=183757 RepID=A0A7H1KNS8_9EURY|nr:hypothetical protein HCAOCCDF_00040 [uncultured Methanosarcinales archaeon]
MSDLNRTIYLPAIQREFVWTTDGIEKLFDSIMGDYPISSFLFWKIQENNKKDWTSYEFIRDHDQESPHNTEADLSGVNRDVYLVLDGQQRLTSLYIGLKGSYRYFYYTWRKTELYLNLLKKPIRSEENQEELVYQFQFRESPETNNPDKEFWYRVGKILDFMDSEDAKADLRKEMQYFDDSKQDNANKLLGRLHTRIHIYPFINFYEEKSQDYDKVVEVFIRANTGGKNLEYSDILLSTATAKWKNLNAREEIQNFTDSINKIGSGYRFGKDFVLKGSLYLTEDLPIQYKVKNFTKDNLEKIENNWDTIKKNIEDTVRLVDKYGFNVKNITSTGALLPISFYLMKLDKNNFVDSSDGLDVENQKIMQKWLILSLLKNVFGGSSDTTLKNMRDALINQTTFSTFPSKELNKKLSIESNFSEMEIDNILNINYSTKYSFLVLSLLYPNRDWKGNKYQEDHIFPKTEFTPKRLEARGYDEETINKYRRYFNTILNLQLLTDKENLEKSSQDFGLWITTRDSNFKERHSIPDIESYDFDCFLEFIGERCKPIKKKLEFLSA